MKVIISGGCGFIGVSLAQSILHRGTLKSHNGTETEVKRVILFDAVSNDSPALQSLQQNPKVKLALGNITDVNSVQKIFKLNTTKYEALSVFHLASILSGAGEKNFDLCINVNLHGTLNILESLRKIQQNQGVAPKIVFTSTNAVFAATDTITDDTPLTPQTTYGMTKICCEKLINDYTRKGFVIGSGARLPSVLIRPEANTAASNCFNAVMREPLRGVDYKCTVPLSVIHPITSKNNVINSLIYLHDLENSLLGVDKFVVLPARSYSLLEMYNSAKKFAEHHNYAIGTVTEEVLNDDYNIVKNWPPFVHYQRARDLGLPDDINIDHIVEEFYNTFVRH